MRKYEHQQGIEKQEIRRKEADISFHGVCSHQVCIRRHNEILSARLKDLHIVIKQPKHNSDISIVEKYNKCDNNSENILIEWENWSN